MGKNIIIFIVIFVVSIGAKSQVVTVTNSKNRPIESVFLFSSKKSVLTNVFGKADITEFNENDSITFQHPSYQNIYISKKTIERLNYRITLLDGVYDIEDVVVSANKWEEKEEEVPCKIKKLSKQEIKIINPQTTADMLSATNEIFVQKSQMGGGSPMIRGFAANRILIVVDGIRMNNAIYRSGNLQNVISIDANSIENSEIIFGPGSVIYGSDAIGGVLDFHTINPSFSEKEIKVKVGSLLRYSSANNEKTGNFNINIGGKKIASFTNFTYSDFSDLKMGNIGNDDYIIYDYIEKINGIDSTLRKTDKNLQKNTAYNQLNILQKFLYSPNKRINIGYNFQYSKLSNVNRYDRLTEYKDNKLKYAEWYYGPQELMLSSFNVSINKHSKFYDKLNFIIANQMYEESRNDRKLNSNLLRNRIENLKIYSVNLDFEKDLDSSSFLFYGLEGLYNLVNSKATQTNITNNTINNSPSRYPNNSTYSSIASYVSYKNNLSKKHTVIAGLRYNRIFIKGVLDTSFYKFPFRDININTGSLNGSIGYVYRLNKKTQINANLSTGFRAPNIDDVGKIFDSEPGAVVVPNTNLKPENAYNFDIGIVKSTKIINIEVSAFYTYLSNVMVRDDFTFNGNDSILYDGVLSKVEAVVNNDYAKLYGISFYLNIKINKNLQLKTFATYTKGFDNNSNALRHVPPPFGSTYINYENKKILISLYFNYNSEISFNNLAKTEQNKPHLYAKDKNDNPYSPAWYTVNLKMNYKINDKLLLSTGIENILNIRYRPYSSGIVSPGRNFIISIRGNFN